MIVEVKLDYNPDTGEVRVIGSTQHAPKTTVEVEESDVPSITLDSNKYSLNKAAAKLLGAEPGSRIDIKYQKIQNVEYPVIGTSESFGTKSGNLLTKSYTVSYRGQSNERLARFGSEFELTHLKDSPGIFVLIGNAEIPEVPDEIEVKESEDVDFDLPEDMPLDDSLEGGEEIDDSIFD